MKLGSADGTFVVEELHDGGESHRGFPVAPLHVHRSEDEAWYVLEGRLGFRIGEQETEIGPGQGILAPRGVPHTFWNAAGGPTRYLIVMGPRTAALVEAIHTLDPADRAALPALFREYDSELL